MTRSVKPSAVRRVACKIYLKEVPITEAVVPEATDYVAHSCGLECYEKWKKRHANGGSRIKKPGA